MAPESLNDDHDLDELRQRRSELREAMAGLEAAIAAPAPGRVAEWTDEVRLHLDQVSVDFARHIAVTEGPGGFHRDLIAASPRLVGKIARLAREHRTIAAAVDAAQGTLDGIASDEDVEAVRKRITDILALLVRHRQHGGDLVWEAFAYDVGGET